MSLVNGDETLSVLDNYMTAQEAATEIGIEYATFMSRCRKGWYVHEKKGHTVFILKTEVAKARKMEEDKRASTNPSMAKAAG